MATQRQSYKIFYFYVACCITLFVYAFHKKVDPLPLKFIVMFIKILAFINIYHLIHEFLNLIFTSVNSTEFRPSPTDHNGGDTPLFYHLTIIYYNIYYHLI